MKLVFRKKNIGRNILILLTFFSLLMGSSHAVLADIYQEGRRGSITVDMVNQGTPAAGLELLLYRVGSLGSGNYINFILDASLKGSGVDLNALTTAEASRAAADSLAKLVRQSGISPMTAVTDRNGRAVFSNLEQGMYLIVEKNVDEKLSISPLLAAIPYMEDGEHWIYDITAAPKIADNEKEIWIDVSKKVSLVDDNFDLVDLKVKDATYYVGLFYDEKGTIPYSKDYVIPIRIQDAYNGSIRFENLPPGTYYILETDAAGNPTPMGELQTDGKGNGWSCSVVDGSSNKVTVDYENNPSGSVALNNIYLEIPDGFSIEANLSITKNVRKGGQQTTINDKFYAGIFTREEDGTQVWVQTVELEQNGTVQVSLPLGGEDATGDITYIVLETDKEGTPVDKSVFPYEVSGEGEASFTRDSTKGSVTITNTIPADTVTPAPTKTPQPGTPGSNGPGTGKSPVKTGDDTPVGIWLAVMAAAAAAGAALLIRKKKNR